MNIGVLKLLGFVFILVGIIIGISVVKHTMNVNSIIENGVITDGEIVYENLVQFNESDYYVYYADFIVDGKKYTVKTKNNSSKSTYLIGDKISIYYDANNPNKSMFNNDSEKKGSIKFGFFITFILILCGTGFIFKGEKILITLKTFKIEE